MNRQFYAAAVVVPPLGITYTRGLADGLRGGQAPARARELMRRVHDSVKAISALVAGPGSKLNKADISNVAAYGHEILAVVAALNLRLAEAELQVAQAKLEAARASRTAAVSGGLEASSAQPRSYASALRL
ncbi:hypothetical protein EVAR_39540_1 [Eumeta japonica]|uniref:Uncharacterized protein n=1 Tax=Eumeta variegata TaxID=151549 RepID=A0A4C1XKC3_EUMVA|nr:hypothetical protein EVAR_39540_1 [Eumeta japonica]